MQVVSYRLDSNHSCYKPRMNFPLSLYYSNLLNNISYLFDTMSNSGLRKKCCSFGTVMLSRTLIISGKAPFPVRKWNSFGMSFSRKKTERIREEARLHSRSPKILTHARRRAGIHQTLAEGKGHNFPTLKYMGKVELLLKIVPMTNPIKFKKLGSIFLEAELLSSLTLGCFPPCPPNPAAPQCWALSFAFVMTLGGKGERDWTVFYIQFSDIKSAKNKITQIKIISKHQKFWGAIYCPYTTAMFSHSPLDSLSVPREQWDCRKQMKISLSCAMSRPRQCSMQKLCSKCKKSSLLCKPLNFAS